MCNVRTMCVLSHNANPSVTHVCEMIFFRIFTKIDAPKICLPQSIGIVRIGITHTKILDGNLK